MKKYDKNKAYRTNNIEIIDDFISIIHIKNRKGEIFDVIVDTEDVEKINSYDYKWNVGWNVIKGDNYRGHYYVRASKYLGLIDGKPQRETVYLHRFILGISDRFVLIDHINTNSLDNRKENMKITDFKGNTINRTGANLNSGSGERNVCWIKETSVWRVQLQVDGQNTKFGDFEDIEDAIACARKMRKILYKQ
jgi:hypothetical protein